MNRIKCSWAANDPKAKNTEKNGPKNVPTRADRIFHSEGSRHRRFENEKRPTGDRNAPDAYGDFQHFSAMSLFIRSQRYLCKFSKKS